MTKPSIECVRHISGVTLIGDPRFVQDLTKLGARSPDGLSYSFDSRSNGYSRSEGVVLIVIKRPSDVDRDGDTVRAVIHASGANHDGRTKGIFAPSSEAQGRLVRGTYKSANLGYKYTSYVKAHGTGRQMKLEKRNGFQRSNVTKVQ
ncbi:hypothetical protein N7457_001187 [Penicillium paradoxum]|uniref:uncharacterized protein n=1 Tax=Penicillium paradoxum TaxID=176176 RepID=UPI0025479375|nr:uncharacterized protein N7457_001187 [Penicillium paradoxum]KAJ5794588.1 hypothetical protein N7457_001187 [Penicillium paradoxum]